MDKHNTQALGKLRSARWNSWHVMCSVAAWSGLFRVGILLAVLVGGMIAIRAEAAAMSSERPYTVVMVLPRPEQAVELAFKRYLVMHGVRANFLTVRYVDRAGGAAAAVDEVKALKPDLVYTWGTPATLAIAGRYDEGRAPLGDVPIVFAEVTDPVAVHLLSSLEKPGRNLTGVPHVAPLEAQLKAMRTYRAFRRIGYIESSREPNSIVVRQELARLTKAERLELIAERVEQNERGEVVPGAVAAAVKRVAERGADVLYIGPSTLLAFTYRDEVASTAANAGLPTFCSTESILRESSCLFGMFSSGDVVGQYAAYKAMRILTRQELPSQIAATPLARFSVMINMPVARQIKLYPPLSLLQIAEIVGANNALAMTPLGAAVNVQ